MLEDALCEDARDAFEHNLGLFALPVVDKAAQPVGLVNRFTFLDRFATRFGRELTAKKCVSDLMDTDPLILDADTNIDELGTRLLAQQHRYVLDGFIVVVDGRYTGVGTGLDLIRALTDRRHAELQRMAHHDVLTGLPNRARFERHLTEAFSNRAASQRLAVLFMDLDRFKQVNDTYGHRVGDVVLCTVAERLRASVRASDLVARLSGDEFGLVLSEVGTPDDAENVAKVLLATCAALRQAIEQGTIQVHYQPIVEIETRRVTGVEALVRWNDSGFGPVSADVIVRIAEDSGLIVRLGEYVLRAAIAQMKDWDRVTGRTDLRLSVNVSPVQIHQGGLVQMIDRALGESGFDPLRLDLELTERAAMRGVSVLPTLHAIKSRGLTLTLDDFGSAQGFLLARPMPGEEMVPLLTRTFETS